MNDRATVAAATGAPPGSKLNGRGMMQTGRGGRPCITGGPLPLDGGLPLGDEPSNPLGQLRDAIQTGMPAGVLDIARPNGADCAFMADLLNQVDVAALAAFAAWNTAGNSIGTVVATLAAANAALKSGMLGRSARPLDALCQFLFERLVDDWLYQSVVRSEVNSSFASVPGVNLHNLEQPGRYEKVNNMVREKLGRLARDLYAQFFSGRPVPLGSSWAGADDAHRLRMPATWPDTSRVSLEVRLPWERTFEVQIRVSW